MENKFTEQQLVALGFTENYVPMEESGADLDYTYYTFELEEHISLISDSYEGVKELAEVYFFEGKKPLNRELIEQIVKDFE